jgi:putative transposase
MNQIYPDLFANVEIISPNQVCTIDITDIKLPDRFMYFSAVIDLYSRYILSYDLWAPRLIN